MAEQQTVETEEVETEEVTGELSLLDVFKDSEEEEVVETAETEDDKGEVEAKAEPEEEAKAETKVESPSTESIGLQAALVAERQKRQAVEEKLRNLEEPEKIPDPIEDPDGFSAHVKAESTKGLLETKISLSRSLIMSVKEDFPEKEKVFMDLVGRIEDGKLIITNELLFKQFQDSDNPGLFAYDHAVDHLLAEKYKDPDFEKNLEARLTEKILAGLKKEGTGLKATDVPDLTKATASGSNTEPVEREVTEVNQLFPEDDNL